MKNIDELFHNARNAPPPLSIEEAKSIVAGTPIKPLKAIHPLKILWGIGALATVTTLAVVFYMLNTPANTIAGKTSTTTNNITTQSNEVAEAPQKNRGEMNTADKTTAISTEAVSKQEHAPDNYSQTTHSQIGMGDESVGEPENSLPPDILLAENTAKPEKPAAGVIPDQEPQQQQILMADTVLHADTGTADTVLAAEDVPTPTGDTTIASVNTNTRQYKHFLKTDLLGYLYNVFPQQLFFRTDLINPKPLSGNRILIGYEYLFPNRRISVGINAAYGFAPYSSSASITMDSATIGTERYTNFKGLILNMEARYYFGKNRNKGMGFYAGIYGASGFFQERVFIQQIPSVRGDGPKTLITSKGNSWGVGLTTGYKFQLGSFYLEPSIGIIVVGKDSKYYNWSYKGQKDIPRHRTLNRYEINFGYRF